MNAPTIRRVVATAVDTIELIDAPAPVPEAGEVSIRVTVSGICGSDLHAVAGHHPWMTLPIALGHEVVGVVDAVGDGVTSIETGTRVTVEPTLPCRDCKQCRLGNVNICENLSFLGCGAPQGALADSFTIPADRVQALDDAMSDLDAVLIEPLATPCHAVRLAAGDEGSLAGRAVVVIGAGTIGQFVLAAVQDRGADRVVVVDPMESKRDLAVRRGAEAAFDSAGDVVAGIRAHFGESADFVFDCVAIEPTISQAVRLCDRAGTVALVGVPARDVIVPVQLLQDRQIRLQGCATYLSEDYATATRIITSGTVSAADFVSADFPLADLDAAFAAARDPQTVKVVVHP